MVMYKRYQESLSKKEILDNVSHKINVSLHLFYYLSGFGDFWLVYNFVGEC